MGFATDRDKVGVIQQGLNSAFWTDYLLPMLMDKAKNNLTALAMKAGEDDDIKRGRYQAYQDVINSPGREVAAYNEAETAAAEKDQDEATAEYRADYGFRSPVRQAPDVGELKGDESANTGS